MQFITSKKQQQNKHIFEKFKKKSGRIKKYIILVLIC